MTTVHQDDLLALLRDFKCLRESHVNKYMAAKHNSTDAQMSRILRQLVYLGMITINNGFITLPGRKLDHDVIKAFDVLMDLTNGAAEEIYPGVNPFTIMFSVKPDEDKPASNTFGMAIVGRYCENSICGRLSRIDRELTVIFVLDASEQQMLLNVENKSYCAIQDENGKYKFYKMAIQP